MHLHRAFFKHTFCQTVFDQRLYLFITFLTLCMETTLHSNTYITPEFIMPGKNVVCEMQYASSDP